MTFISKHPFRSHYRVIFSNFYPIIAKFFFVTQQIQRCSSYTFLKRLFSCLVWRFGNIWRSSLEVRIGYYSNFICRHCGCVNYKRLFSPLPNYQPRQFILLFSLTKNNISKVLFLTINVIFGKSTLLILLNKLKKFLINMGNILNSLHKK